MPRWSTFRSLKDYGGLVRPYRPLQRIRVQSSCLGGKNCSPVAYRVPDSKPGWALVVPPQVRYDRTHPNPSHLRIEATTGARRGRAVTGQASRHDGRRQRLDIGRGHRGIVVGR